MKKDQYNQKLPVCSGQIARKSLDLSWVFIGTIFLFLFSSCNPSQKEAVLPAPINSSALQFKVSQKSDKDNIVYLQSLTAQAIPFWNYGSGTSTNVYDTVIFPFSGDYTIQYGVSSKGGYVEGDSAVVHVTQTDLSFLTDPNWAYIAGETGKTWVLDMARPVGWYGLDYPKRNKSSEDWSYHPDYAGNEWVMPNRDYGSMRFDLNNGKNYARTYIDDQGVAKTTKGQFNLDPAQHSLKLTGAELLYGGVYYAQASNWHNITLLDMSATSITLGVLRDKPIPPDGVCYIGFTFKLKQ